MQKPTKKDFVLFAIQAAAWAIILLLPEFITWFTTHDWQYTKSTLLMTLSMFQSPLLIYFANFYIFDRWLFQRRRYVWFAVANLLLMLGLNWALFFIGQYAPDMPDMYWAGMYIGFFIYFLLNCAMIAAALGLRHFVRVRRIRQQLQEEQARHTEAELAWLKSQINPHFLFNTLNNISSLAIIDGEATQEAIAQLSDLLRYAMYETDKSVVPLGGEVDFMRNYIALMKLRCSEKTDVSFTSSIANLQAEVAPLLFISLVENAFKHGISSNRPSFIRITLEQKSDGTIVFDCENTNYPKPATDHSGSGIGLENTRRRLELLYPDRYTWERGVSTDGQTYRSHIEIHCL